MLAWEMTANAKFSAFSENLRNKLYEAVNWVVEAQRLLLLLNWL
jgi:hypothetical protein